MSELVTAVPTVAAPASPQTGRPHRHRSPCRRKVVNYGLLVVVILIYLYPLVFLVNTALKSNGEFFSNPTGLVKAPHLSNFSTAWVRATSRPTSSTASCTRSSQQRWGR